MKRFIVTLILLATITCSIVYVMVAVLARGPQTSSFNIKYRPLITAHPYLRTIFSLHDYGDARFDYINPDTKNITIEVDAMDDIQLDQSALNRFADTIQTLTKKPTTLLISNTLIPSTQVSSSLEIDRLIRHYRNKFTNNGTAVIYLLYVHEAGEETKELGSTYEESAILMFQNALDNFTDKPDVKSAYQFSTLLHEFGHQLGLPHNDFSGCIMNPNAESDHTAKTNPKDVITDFCNYEKQQLNLH